MDYRDRLGEENAAVRERYDLSMERIAAMEEEELAGPCGIFFQKTAKFIGLIRAVVARRLEGRTLGAEEKAAENRALYEDILPGQYEKSWANPAYAAAQVGEELGRLLAFLYTEIRGQIAYAFEMRLEDITITNEIFIEVYNLFEQAQREGENAPSAQSVRDALYWFVSDYADRTVRWRVREMLDPGLRFATDIILQADLSDPEYLYEYGEYISEHEIAVARFFAGLSQEKINRMADTYTEGFRRGFEVMGRDLSKKSTVVLEYHLGFERMMRRAIENFQKLGLEPIVYRPAVEAINRRTRGKRGYTATSANRQYDYDHRYDSALFMGAAIKERKLAVTRAAYEEFRELASRLSGPAVVETFGEEGFEPENKPEAFSYTDHQQEVSSALANEIGQVVNRYVPEEETSFTIIAFPLPQIGADFEAIFEATMQINTLDYEKYQRIQQTIIDALDQAEAVHVLGGEGNETDICVRLHKLHDPEKESNFENCVADVNIPLGEVFTSPVLNGTTGLLHVGSVYVDEYQFKNLRLTFENGRVKSFSCENFGTDEAGMEQGRKLVRQVIMAGHDWLPLGEFAIGTNTVAYAVARQFDIGAKLPILIAEKTGPHFAVGDTCYSFAEDSAMYNPNGKEVIARENEISALRTSDPSKAYFSCHTDITIPYSELGSIRAVCGDGRQISIIENGRFVLPGTEELNQPLDAGVISC